MSFVSTDFALLLACTLFGYALLPRRGQNALVLAASYVFYGSWSWKFLGLLCATTLMDFLVGQGIHAAAEAGDERRKKLWLRTSLSVNLLVLGFFKYWGFFTQEAREALGRLGLSLDAPTLEVVLPIGISFYTFQSMAYAIDVYRGRMQPSRDLLDFAAFVAFFPQLVAGPIERAAHMLPQFAAPRRVTLGHVRDGLWLMLIGFVRKVVIADTAAHFAERVFRNPGEHGRFALIAGLLLFTIQIYGDFAGYSDIARGTAKLLGFDLMRNFEQPYFARNVSDFWRRWHISLSTWLRDYLYIPLGGNRHGEPRTYVNLMITMLLGGLWHGASWNFVIWGGLHGAYLALHRAASPDLAELRALAGERWGRAFTVAGALCTFALVAFTWLFFRSTSFELTLEYLSGLRSAELGEPGLLLPVLVLGSAMLALDLPPEVSGDDLAIAHEPRWLRVPIAALMLALLAISSDSGAPFIYFQF